MLTSFSSTRYTGAISTTFSLLQENVCRRGQAGRRTVKYMRANLLPDTSERHEQLLMVRP